MTNKQLLSILAVSTVLILLLVFLDNTSTTGKNDPQTSIPNVTSNTEKAVENQEPTQNLSAFLPPLSDAKERITKKHFGQYITPQNSPVQPERFIGYHTGTDFEILPGEENTDVTVTAVCDGTLRVKNTASGYGGHAVQDCILNEEPVTVVYGHLRISSISLNTGDQISAGDNMGLLGAGNTLETNGERKHLHLSIHKGTGINITGYVSTPDKLSKWIDPESLLE